MTDTQDSLYDVRGRVIVVSGGLGQLGRQFTKTLLQRGAKVALLDLKEPENGLESFFGELSANTLFVRGDVTDKESLEQALETITAHWETPSGLVNNAALDSPPNAPAEENGPFETYPVASFEKILQVNVTGVFLCCQVFGRAMAEAGRGSIINICSTYGVVSPNQDLYTYRRERGETFFKPVAYSVSKSALLNLTRYLATYWAKQGVRVNTLTFGGVFNNQDQEFLQAYGQRVPMGRMADESEYNGAVVFLLSDASSYMTGSNMILDGGWTAW